MAAYIRARGRGNLNGRGFLQYGPAFWLIFASLVVAAVAALISGLLIGPSDFTLSELAMAVSCQFTGDSPPSPRIATATVVLLKIRLPRMFAAAVIGAALATSGASYQAVFANPLVSPGILGVVAGASFGAAMAILFDLPWPLVQLAAFGIGLSATAFALFLARGVAGNRVLALVLGGVVSSALFTALVSLVKMVADPTSQLPAIVFWLMGSLTHVNSATLAIAAPVMIAAVLCLAAMGRALDLLAMGDEEAAALGLPVHLLRLAIILLATLAVSVSVSLVGAVGWVGLIVPHITRGIFGAMNRRVLPASMLVGATFLMVVDTICRSLLTTEIPLGIATALVGVPFLAFLMRRGVHKWRG